MSLIRGMHSILVGCLFCFNVFAGSDTPVLVISETEELNNRWSFLASFGYTEFQKTHRAGSQTVLGRLALAAELLTTYQANFGLELGLQTGNRMHLMIPYGVAAFGSAVRTTIMPMLDLLVTAHANPVDESLLYTQLKGGIAFRYWQLNSIYFNNKSEISGELQAGFGYPLTELSNLNLLYQGIFGGNPRLHPSPGPLSGYISNLPIQHGLLFGFSVIV